MSLRWRIYYGDGSTWSDRDGPPEQSPALDVQVIVQMDPTRVLLHGGSSNPFNGYFWFEDGLWTIGDLFGLWDYLARPGWKIVRFGRSIDTAQFHETVKRVVADPDFPKPKA